LDYSRSGSLNQTHGNKELEMPWTMADEQGWDANDLHVKSGLFNVVAKIMELKRKVLTSVSA